MFFFGDFTHFPPVKDTPLYHRFSSKTVKNSISQTDVLCNLGLALWQHLTHVALLTQQMLVTDVRYQEVLARLRLGRCNLDDVLLSTRILNNNINYTIINETPVNVLGNKLRLDINCLLVNHHSETLGEVVQTVWASDASKKSTITDDDKMLLSHLPSTQTGG